MEETKGPWCAHVSYIKPHWPYIVPAPYHDMFGANHVPAAKRHEAERDDPQPVFGAYMENKIAQAFQKDEVRQKVIPAYMGLIKQCDDQLGRLLDYLELVDRTGRALRSDKRGAIDATLTGILSRLDIDQKQWLAHMAPKKRRLPQALGSLASLKAFAQATGRRWVAGQRHASLWATPPS